MNTKYRRQFRYHGDRGMQMIVGAVLAIGWFGMAALLAIAAADWMTGYDTLYQLALQVMK